MHHLGLLCVALAACSKLWFSTFLAEVLSGNHEKQVKMMTQITRSGEPVGGCCRAAYTCCRAACTLAACVPSFRTYRLLMFRRSTLAWNSAIQCADTCCSCVSCPAP
jgi:hypothetical protein